MARTDIPMKAAFAWAGRVASEVLVWTRLHESSERSLQQEDARPHANSTTRLRESSERLSQRLAAWLHPEGQAARASSHRKAQAGFTLVEVLVAMMIMAIMAVMAWQGVDGIVRARDASQERLERQLRLNTVLAQWEQDLANVRYTRSVPVLTFDGSTLRLTRTSPGGVQVVAWALRGNAWMRWASPPVTTIAELQEGWMRSQQLLGNETGQVRLMSGVSQWQVYFYRQNAWTNSQSSDDRSPDNNTTPPRAVRIIMTFDGTGLSGMLTRDISLGPQPE